jgi:formylglycine-generating enzyme required for sulfatase activity
MASAMKNAPPSKYGKMKVLPNYLQRSGYRLPTEVEWEYACRAGSEAGYAFGEPQELLARYAWFVENSLSQTRPVGRLKPNDVGLFDMHGNVWQWTLDTHKAKPLNEEDDRGEVISGASTRVARGGCWIYTAGLCRASHRNGSAPDLRYFDLGFRLARGPVASGGK